MPTVIYVAIVEGSQDAGYAAHFPDLPGCVTAAETMIELPGAAREALTLHLRGMVEDGYIFPEPTPLEAIKSDVEVNEIGRILVDADVEDTPVRVNISLGAQFLKRVDIAAEARGMTRSGFLVEGARQLMSEREEATNVVFFPVDNLQAAVPLEGRARVFTLGAHMCKWPIGDPSSSEFSFCGRRAAEGVYCVEHARVAYQPRQAVSDIIPSTVSSRYLSTEGLFGGGYSLTGGIGGGNQYLVRDDNPEGRGPAKRKR